jgi:hypothetical protein
MAFCCMDYVDINVLCSYNALIVMSNPYKKSMGFASLTIYMLKGIHCKLVNYLAPNVLLT